MHHPKSDANRLYLTHKEKSSGLAQPELSLKASIIETDTQACKKHKENTYYYRWGKNIPMRLTLALATFLKILHLLKKQNKLRNWRKLKILMN